jgi:hypothetical protein
VRLSLFLSSLSQVFFQSDGKLPDKVNWYQDRVIATIIYDLVFQKTLELVYESKFEKYGKTG